MTNVDKVNWGGVVFNKNNVSLIGQQLDTSGVTKYFINFNDGKKVEYYKQNDGNAEIKYDDLGKMHIFDVKKAIVSGSLHSDSFILDACCNIVLKLCDIFNSNQTENDRKDEVEIKENCERIIVHGDNADTVYNYASEDDTKTFGEITYIKK